MNSVYILKARKIMVDLICGSVNRRLDWNYLIKIWRDFIKFIESKKYRFLSFDEAMDSFKRYFENQMGGF
jgi:hypothetical protein